MKLVRMPALAQWCWPRRRWHEDRSEPVLYLTFDDGPTPGVTDQILDALDQYQAQATFFSVGDQARRNPDLLREVQARGHRIGNHTHTHLNGFKTPFATYWANVSQCQDQLARILGEAPQLFRPPYGRLPGKTARALRKQFDIVMWDTLAYDWRADLSPEAVSQNVISKARPGSIVVLHDSQKAADRVLGALPQILAHFQAKGFQFRALPEQ